MWWLRSLACGLSQHMLHGIVGLSHMAEFDGFGNSYSGCPASTLANQLRLHPIAFCYQLHLLASCYLRNKKVSISTMTNPAIIRY